MLLISLKGPEDASLHLTHGNMSSSHSCLHVCGASLTGHGIPRACKNTAFFLGSCFGVSGSFLGKQEMLFVYFDQMHSPWHELLALLS